MASNSLNEPAPQNSLASLIEQIEFTLHDVDNHVGRMFYLLRGPKLQEAPESPITEEPLIDRLRTIRDRTDKLDRQAKELVHLIASD